MVFLVLVPRRESRGGGRQRARTLTRPSLSVLTSLVSFPSSNSEREEADFLAAPAYSSSLSSISTARNATPPPPVLSNPAKALGRWAPKESNHLRDIVVELGEDWDAVANELGVRMSPREAQRTPGSCKARWTKLKKLEEEVEAAEASLKEEEGSQAAADLGEVRLCFCVFSFTSR